ncbi:MAG: hypothetical protein IIX39_03305, partial [Clostridia bacterium]|nr:hypothetical protein [Clostridia bacterium]
RRVLIRKFLFLKQNSLYYHQKPRKATSLAAFLASIQAILPFYETAQHFKMRNYVCKIRQKPPITLSRIGGF